ncbi:hypothetical protein ACFLYQ_07670 [Chloroflexota bacterium]
MNRKLISPIMVVLFMGLLLTGCSPVQEEESEEASHETAKIEVSFDSNPIQCEDGMWKWRVIITEINSVGVKLNGLVYEIYGDDGKKETKTLGSDWFEGILPSGYLSPDGVTDFGGGIPCQELSHIIYKVSGIDDKGNKIEAVGRADFQGQTESKEAATDTAKIEISFDSNLVQCEDGMWKWRVIITEVNGIGVKLDSVIQEIYADSGMVEERVNDKGDWFEQWLTSAYLLPSGSANFGAGFPCQAISHCIYKVTGVDDNGNSIEAEGRVDFQK